MLILVYDLEPFCFDEKTHYFRVIPIDVEFQMLVTENFQNVPNAPTSRYQPPNSREKTIKSRGTPLYNNPKHKRFQKSYPSKK